MLAKTKNGTEVSIEFVNDVEPNENGFYCEIYRYDEDGECEQEPWDNFCIHPEDCPTEGCFDDCGGPTSEAEEYAARYVSELSDDGKSYSLYVAVKTDHWNYRTVDYTSEDKECVELHIRLKMRERDINIRYSEKNDQWDRPYQVISTPQWDYGFHLETVTIYYGDGCECKTRGEAESEAHYRVCEYAHDLRDHYLDDYDY